MKITEGSIFDPRVRFFLLVFRIGEILDKYENIPKKLSISPIRNNSKQKKSFRNMPGKLSEQFPRADRR